MKQNYIGSVLGILTVMWFTAAVTRADSLTPVFGEEGAEFKINAADGHKIAGWLPKDWVDNSEWAAVSATYAKLPAADAPQAGITAVRIAVTEIASGQLQFSSWVGKQVYRKGTKYAVQGWVRSKAGTGISVGVRQMDDPYEFYAQEDLETGDKWKPFKFEFNFDEDKEGVIMFVVKDAGAVDVAGITCGKQ